MISVLGINDRMPVGQFKGRLIGDLMKLNQGNYLKWAIQNGIFRPDKDLAQRLKLVHSDNKPQLQEGKMPRVVLLSCTKSKVNYLAPAQELYAASPMFMKTLEYGKSLKPDKMYILSAKHHLVPLNKKLAPYDKTLKDATPAEKEAWGEKVHAQMLQAGIDPKNTQFIFLTGREYMKPLLKYIPEENIALPLEGKRFGQRLKWLNTQLQRLHETIKKLRDTIYENFQRQIKRIY
jgi:hypothetical protein